VKPLKLNATAKSDLRKIARYSVFEFGTRVADRYLAGLELVFDRIAATPETYRIFEGVVPETRVLSYKRHRIFYRIENDHVVFVRILHQRQDDGQLNEGY
jgi:toxin ParE1/3/4